MFDEVKSKRVNKNKWRDLPGGPVVKTSPSSVRDLSSIPHAWEAKNGNIKQKQCCNKFKKDLRKKKKKGISICCMPPVS